MIAVDTNVLVRILIDDPEEIEQTQAARKLARAAGTVFVPQIVQVECVWVLKLHIASKKPQSCASWNILA